TRTCYESCIRSGLGWAPNPGFIPSGSTARIRLVLKRERLPGDSCMRTGPHQDRRGVVRRSGARSVPAGNSEVVLERELNVTRAVDLRRDLAEGGGRADVARRRP